MQRGTTAHDGRNRVYVGALRPVIDGGRHPVNRILGEQLDVEADILADGHDILAAVVLFRHEKEPEFREMALKAMGNDVFAASFELSQLGLYEFTVEAWIDTFATYRHGLSRKVEANQDVTVELLDGAALLSAAKSRASGDDGGALETFAKLLSSDAPQSERINVALSAEVRALTVRHPDRSLATRYHKMQQIRVDPKRARFSAWYEMFPRSAGTRNVHGTLADVEARLGYVASMGFDILYLPPIHPIGKTYRKGPNNSPTAGPTDPGSPWAIGSEEGGHESIHSELGTFDDFDRLVRRARSMGIEIALDIAFQASPDHPWVREHPEWFKKRADGSIQYAENPPKKYQDVYPFDFESPAWESLWAALRGVFLFWIGKGVHVFRVDNPHTKPIPFWEWCIRTIKEQHPEVIFLAEAFTRPKLKYALAKVGFSQGYTYFTWRTTSHDLTKYMQELTRSEVGQFFRPNFWPNTPDILPEHLQHGGRGMFLTRLVLAATLSSNYGIYGPPYELMEHVARSGAEEYVDNEKYEIRSWDRERADSLQHIIARINRSRREHPALQRNDGLHFHASSNELILCYSKQSPDGNDIVLAAVNLDPHHKHSAWIELDLAVLGLADDEVFQVHDLLSDTRYQFRGAKNYVELDPAIMPAHLFAVRRLQRSEHNFEYFL